MGLTRATKQPGQVCTAPGYSFVWTAGVPMDMVGNTPASPVGTAPGKTVSQYQGQPIVAATFSGAAQAAGHLSFGVSPAATDALFTNPTGGTLHILCRIPAASPAVGCGLIGKVDDNNTGIGWGMYVASGFGYPVLFISSHTSSSRISWTTSLGTNTWALISVTSNGGADPVAANPIIYRDGVVDAGSWIAGPFALAVNTDVAQLMRVGCEFAGVGTTTDMLGDIALVAIARRRQTANEVAAVAANPWGIFQTRGRLVSSDGSSTPTLSAAAATSITTTTAKPQVTLTF